MLQIYMQLEWHVFVIQFLTQHKGHACCGVSNCGVLLSLLLVHILVFLVILYLPLTLFWRFALALSEPRLQLKKHSLQENAPSRNA